MMMLQNKNEKQATRPMHSHFSVVFPRVRVDRRASTSVIKQGCNFDGKQSTTCFTAKVQHNSIWREEGEKRRRA